MAAGDEAPVPLTLRAGLRAALASTSAPAEAEVRPADFEVGKVFVTFFVCDGVAAAMAAGDGAPVPLTRGTGLGGPVLASASAPVVAEVRPADFEVKTVFVSFFETGRRPVKTGRFGGPDWVTGCQAAPC